MATPPPPQRVGRVSQRRLAATQRRHLVELQLSTRIAFLESRLDALVQRVVGVSAEVMATPPASWPPPAPGTQLSSPDALELFRIAGEYQRMRSYCAMQRVQAAAAAMDRSDFERHAQETFLETSLPQQSNSEGADAANSKIEANEAIRADCVNETAEHSTLSHKKATSDFLSVLVREQRALTEIPMLSMGAVGLWGRRNFDLSSAAANYKEMSRLLRLNRELDPLLHAAVVPIDVSQVSPTVPVAAAVEDAVADVALVEATNEINEEMQTQDVQSLNLPQDLPITSLSEFPSNLDDTALLFELPATESLTTQDMPTPQQPTPQPPQESPPHQPSHPLQSSQPLPSIQASESSQPPHAQELSPQSLPQSQPPQSPPQSSIQSPPQSSIQSPPQSSIQSSPFSISVEEPPRQRTEQPVQTPPESSPPPSARPKVSTPSRGIIKKSAATGSYARAQARPRPP